MDPRDKVVSTGYSSPMSKADWASAFLLIVILITAASAYFTFQEIDLLERILEGEHVSEAEALSSDERIMFVGILWLGAYIIAGVFFFIWLHRACKNLDYLEVVDTRFTPGWAIGWWFIPFANLFMPYQVVKSYGKPATQTQFKSIRQLFRLLGRKHTLPQYSSCGGYCGSQVVFWVCGLILN